MLRILIIFGILFCFGSCKKDKNTPALLFVYPETPTVYLKPLEVATFKINGSSDGALLNRFIIRTKVTLQGYTVLLDSSLSSKKFSMEFDYQAPSFSQTTSIQMEFILTDEEGNETQMARIMSVNVGTGDVPKETTGHEMYSSVSGKVNAYDLVNGIPLFSQTASASSQHIRDSTASDSLGTYILSKKWFSPAGLKFVRFVDFDYANATYASLKQSYEAGVKKDLISNITTGDILLTRLPVSNPDSGFLAIKLVYVIDADSSDFDRYIFNIKK